ncbi:MAG: acyl-ACP thioesterase domain-containing protein, partial [Rhodothermales bacterium]
SIQTICDYLQEAAGNHASDLGVSIEHLADRDLTWVLTRLRVEMDRLPDWKDEVVVETWPSGTDRLMATRDFIVRDGRGDDLGRASSAWLLIERTRRRPVRLPEAITTWELPKRERAIDDPPANLPGIGDDAVERQVRVRYGDLDVNGHVNNVRYVEWSVEGVPADVLREQVVCSLDLHFRAEGNYGDVVTVRSSTVPGEEARTYAHVIVRDGDELARARTKWIPR